MVAACKCWAFACSGSNATNFGLHRLETKQRRVTATTSACERAARLSRRPFTLFRLSALLASEEVLVSTLKIKFASTSSAGWLGSLASRYLIQCAVEILIQRLTDGACIVTAADFTRGLVRID